MLYCYVWKSFLKASRWEEERRRFITQWQFFFCLWARAFQDSVWIYLKFFIFKSIPWTRCLDLFHTLQAATSTVVWKTNLEEYMCTNVTYLSVGFRIEMGFFLCMCFFYMDLCVKISCLLWFCSIYVCTSNCLKILTNKYIFLKALNLQCQKTTN